VVAGLLRVRSCSTGLGGAKCNGRHAELVNKIKGPRINFQTTNHEASHEHAQDYAYEIAGAYAYRGEFDEAFAWLDRAYSQKDAGLYLIKSDPFIKNLRGDPRYKAFLRKMNLLE
jgi:hypothetical protein